MINPNFTGNTGNFFPQNTRIDTDTSRAASQLNNQPKRGPKYPQYSITCIRLGTFQAWPTSIQQHPETMAESGFYYTGNNDHVRCFFCGIGLQNWDSEDKPFVEHARWSPECQYLKDKKGIDFINTVQDAVKRVQMEEALHRDGVAETFDNEDFEEDGNAGTNELLPSGKAPSRAEKKNPLLTDAAQSLMLMGYLPKVIKVVLDRVLKQNGWPGLSSRALMEEIYRIEESGEMKKDHMLIPTNVKLKDALSGQKKTILSKDDYKRLEEDSKDTDRRPDMYKCQYDIYAFDGTSNAPIRHMTGKHAGFNQVPFHSSVGEFRETSDKYLMNFLKTPINSQYLTISKSACNVTFRDETADVCSETVMVTYVEKATQTHQIADDQFKKLKQQHEIELNQLAEQLRRKEGEIGELKEEIKANDPYVQGFNEMWEEQCLQNDKSRQDRRKEKRRRRERIDKENYDPAMLSIE